MNDINNLWKKSAEEVLNLLKKKEIKLEELVSSNLQRIEEINPIVNAIVTLCRDEAEFLIKNKKAEFKNTLLKGVPVLIKDNTDVKDVKTTYGSELYSEHIPKESDLVVETLKKRGAIIIGKTNIPEFAAGSHTYNKLFGSTKNPWNLSLSAGGSSGGSAVALATGMAWFATGTDLGGSLRNPSSWCGIVGLRPTPGLVPQGPFSFSLSNLSVNGPMARNVTDLSLFLDGMVTHNKRDPFSFKKSDVSYYKNISEASKKAFNIGFTEDFGVFPCDREIREMTKYTMKLIESLGHNVFDEYPNVDEAEEAFQILRAYLFYSNYKFLLNKKDGLVKEEILWNIKKGKSLSIDHLVKAENIRKDIYQKTQVFFEKFDFLVVPSSVVTPFDIKETWVKNVEGKKLNNYVSWLMIAAAVSLTGCPSIAIPTSFSKKGAPIGVQVIAPPHEEKKLLQFVKTIEEEINISSMIPKNVVSN